MCYSGLDKKYCSDFLDVGETCCKGGKWNFVHTVFAEGFTDNDKHLMEKFI